jgi:hypothetical protein
MGSKSEWEDLTQEDLKRLRDANQALKDVIEDIYRISGGKLINVYEQAEESGKVLVDFNKPPV